MKKRVALICLAFVILSSLLLSSCVKADESELGALRTLSEAVLSAFASDDVQSVYPLFDERYITLERAAEVMPQIDEYLGKFTSFEIKEMTGHTINKSSERTLVRATFLVETVYSQFYVVIGKMTDSDKICALDVSLKEHMQPTYTGTLTTMHGASVIQWVVLILGIALMVFSFWMLLDCAKSRIKRKVIWILFVLLGFLSVTFTLVPGESVRLFFSFGFIISQSTLRVYSTGATSFIAVLPIGAFVYFLRRKELKAAATRTRSTRSADQGVGDTRVSIVSEDKLNGSNYGNSTDVKDSCDKDSTDGEFSLVGREDSADSADRADSAEKADVDSGPTEE